MKTILKYTGAWLGLVILAIINGTLREKTYGRFIGELAAHQLSTLTGIVFFGIYIWFLTGAAKIADSRQAAVIGGIWLIMTVLFEFGFGHYVMGHAWSRLFADYNLLTGRVWVLMLIWTASAPYVFYQIRSNL